MGELVALLIRRHPALDSQNHRKVYSGNQQVVVSVATMPLAVHKPKVLAALEQAPRQQVSKVPPHRIIPSQAPLQVAPDIKLRDDTRFLFCCWLLVEQSFQLVD